MTDATNLIRLVQETQPDEIYNLAAQSHVQVSFETAEYTANADALGTLRLLEAIRILRLGARRARFYQASTSELYGKVQEIPQRETTPFYPRSPYAAAKLYAYWITVNYREAYGMHASNGILFNHESPLRGETFVTRKITRAVAAIELGLQERLYLGNLDAKRDWGHARDYVEGMWLMLQQDEPDDYVLATGETHTVREFVELRLRLHRPPDRVAGQRASTRSGSTRRSGQVLVRVDPRYFRPTEVELLLGDPSKAREQLGWRHHDQLRRAGRGDGRGRPRCRSSARAATAWTEPGSGGEASTMSNQHGPRRAVYRLAGKRVWVAGHRGMVGSALVRRLAREDCDDPDRGPAGVRPRPPGAGRALDGRRPARRRSSSPRPRSAASSPTTRYPAEFLYDNLMIEANVIHAAQRAGVEKLLFLGSTCIYPKLAPQPMPRGGACSTGRSSRPTSGTRSPRSPASSSARPTAGSTAATSSPRCRPTSTAPATTSTCMTSHVLPALIAKMHEAKVAGADEVEIWGTGRPRREFLHVDDLADACVHLIKLYSGELHVNVGCGADLTIAELAGDDPCAWSASAAGCATTASGRTARRASCSTRPASTALGWRPRIALERRPGRRLSLVSRAGRAAAA